ncbi:MAG: coenzyme F420-0:L-glutamate ligase [Candidatus Bathyarchaeota archaeon]|nr:coenzyme F420-0:L-glutamate ligase [Candidatus Bathyarchaeota archaeon]
MLRLSEVVRRISILGLEGFPLIRAGDDLAELIVSTAKNSKVEIEDGDVVIVAQKVVSKAEDRVVQLDTVEPSEKALEIAEKTGRNPRLVELVLRESKRFLKASEEIVIVEDKREIVNINAGIDKSNVQGADSYALLPVDPDESARGLRSRLRKLTGRNVSVIISDTYSRAFRRGQVNFAIGLAGLSPFFDYRGTEDLFGYVMQVKFAAVADELASAAELVMGQGKEAMPVAIVKGLNRLTLSEDSSSKDLVISQKEDLFRNVW